MKKSRLLLVGLASVCLTGCSFLNFGKDKKEEDKPANQSQYEYNPTIVGGTADEQKAILEVLNNKPICNQSGSNTSEIFPETKPNLSEDNGDGIKLTLKQVYNDKTVNLTWDVDTTQTYYGNRLNSDDSHDIIEINYQHYGVADGEFKWSLKKLVCGDAVADNVGIVYTAVCKNEEYYHEDKTIAELYAITDQEKTVDAGGTEHKFASTFDIVDYEYTEGKTYSPYFKTNNPDAKEKQYYYVNVVGKVIYTAPDGNWGLLADGDNVLEFYTGAGKALTTANFPNLAKKYVKISGNMGQYCGNVQLGFITQIKEAKASDITEPTMTYAELTEQKLASLKVTGYTAEKQAVMMDGACLSGALKTVTGTLVADSIKVKNGDKMEAATVDTIASGKRITFQLSVGAETMTVAYDYHTDKSGSNGLYNALKTALQKGAGATITVKGTMRYSGNDSAPFITEGNNGVWNIVPFDATHIA